MPELEEQIKTVIDRYCFDHNLNNGGEPVSIRCSYSGGKERHIFALGYCKTCERNIDLAQMVADCVNIQKEVK